MTDSTRSILKLRILVLTLGEADHAGWWKSRFLSPIGLSFLERIYPRSTFAAAVRSACRAAQDVHDTNIGKGEVFHLFRLPRHIEREIEAALAIHSDELATHYQPLLAERATLMEELEGLTGGASQSPRVGPAKLSVDSKELVPTMATAYLQAFQDETQVFPYFEEDKIDS
jgi:hypothetical protein